MHDAYEDIRSRIDEPPKWFDVHGVPRYCSPNVPSQLMGWVACQQCSQIFYVCLADPVYVNGWGNTNVVRASSQEEETSHLELADDWHYGDPPRHDCPVGNTMNSIPQHQWGLGRWGDRLPSAEASDDELFQQFLQQFESYE